MDKKLVIIGNGFDMFHGICSSYWNFKQYLNETGAFSFIESLEKYILSDELWKSFEAALGHLDYELLESDNSHYMLGYGDENWRDSAHHDYQYMLEQELNFSNDISDYLHEWILSLDTHRIALLNAEILNNKNFFINFNYTDTLENTYDIHRQNIFYIHGKACETKYLIVGHGEKSLTEDKIKREFSSEEEQEMYLEYISGYDVRALEGQEIIRRYFCETYKDVEKIIYMNREIFNYYRGIQTVYVLGHSLADVDLPYFKLLNLVLGSNVSWVVTYYKSEEKMTHANQLMKIGVLPQQICMCTMEQLRL